MYNKMSSDKLAQRFQRSLSMQASQIGRCVFSIHFLFIINNLK